MESLGIGLLSARLEDVLSDAQAAVAAQRRSKLTKLARAAAVLDLHTELDIFRALTMKLSDTYNCSAKWLANARQTSTGLFTADSLTFLGRGGQAAAALDPKTIATNRLGMTRASCLQVLRSARSA